MYFFTSVIWEVCHHSDVIHVGLGGGVEQNRAMEARVVEEIKVDVLHKEAFGVPVGRSHATVKQTVRARRKPSRQDDALTKLTWWRRWSAGWFPEEASPESECCWLLWWSCTACWDRCGASCQSPPQREGGLRCVPPLSRRSPTATQKGKDIISWHQNWHKEIQAVWQISTGPLWRNTDLKSPHHTHHYGIIVSTSHSEDQSGSFISDPAAGNLHLAIVPHPAHKVPQCSVLSDVIVAGRNWHVHHWASLGATQRHIGK